MLTNLFELISNNLENLNPTLLHYSDILLMLCLRHVDNTSSAQENIIHLVDHEFKNNPDNEVSILTHVLMVEHLSIFVKKIKFRVIQPNDHQYQIDRYLLSFETKYQCKVSFYIEKSAAADRYLGSLLDELPNEYVDVTIPKSARHESKPFSLQYWGEKKCAGGIDWDEDPDSKGYYTNINDPMIITAFKKYLLSNESRANNLVLIDIGAGKGRLALEILKLMKDDKKPVTYVFIEPDAYQCAMATLAVKKLQSESNLKHIEIMMFCMTLQKFIESAVATNYIEKTTCVISSGGPLNRRVVSSAEAKENLASIIKLLAPQGKLIASGLTEILFSKKELVAQGLAVLQTSDTIKSGSQLSGVSRQCYVCEKKPTVSIFSHPEINRLKDIYKLPNFEQASIEKALRIAANNNQIADLKILIGYVKNINAQDNKTTRRSALHWAAIKKNQECYDLLLKNGAHPDLPDAENISPKKYLKLASLRLGRNP